MELKLIIIEKTTNTGQETNAEKNRLAMIQNEFGGHKVYKFSELVPRNTNNKICSLVDLKINRLDSVSSNWVIMSINLSKNELTEFPCVLSKIIMLKSLKLDDNMISCVRTDELNQFKNLEQLEIRNNNLKDFCNDFDSYPLNHKEEVYNKNLKVI